MIKPFVATFVGFFTGAFLLAGCGSFEQLTNSFESSDHLVSYRSDRITLEEQPREWSLSLRAIATCEELPCSPDRVHLIFVSRPNQSRYTDNYRLQIEGGGLRLEWPGASYDSADYTAGENIERIHAEISLAHFRDLAFAETLEGRLGSTLWEVSYDERASLRSIVRQLE